MWILSRSWFHVMMTIPAWRFTPKTPILRTTATTTLLPRQRTSIATKPAATNGYVLNRVQCMCGSSVITCFDLATSTITLSSPAMVVLQQRRPPQPRRPPPQAQLKGMPWHMHRPHRPQSQKPTGVRTVMLILANAGVAARPCPVKNQSVRQVRPLCKQGVVAASKFTTTWCRVATQNQGIVQPGLSPTLLRRQQFQLFSWSCLLCACCDALEIDICRFLCDLCNCKYLLCLLCTVSYCTEQSQCTLRAWVWLEEFQLSTRSPLKCLLHFDMFLPLFPTWVRLQCLAFLSRLLFCLAARTKPRWTCRAARLSHLIPWEKGRLLLRCLFWTSFYLTVAGIACDFCEFCAKDVNCTPSPLKAKDENGRRFDAGKEHEKNIRRQVPFQSMTSWKQSGLRHNVNQCNGTCFLLM